MKTDKSFPPPTVTGTSSQNDIETIIRLEEEGEDDRSPAERFSEIIGRLVGTIPFVTSQIVFVSLWVIVNGGRLGSPNAFDPFPFPLLSGVLAFECVLLTAFVLIRQNRMSLRSDRRNHLGLQINLLSEKEITKVIQMLERMSRQMGIEAEVTNSQSKVLAKETSIENIARELRENLDDELRLATASKKRTGIN